MRTLSYETSGVLQPIRRGYDNNERACGVSRLDLTSVEMAGLCTVSMSVKVCNVFNLY